MSLRFTLLAVAGALLAGCGQSDSGPPRAEIKGNVTYNGTPIPDGTISFYPEKGATGIPTSGVIKEGVYDISGRFGIAPGTYRVEFKSFKERPKPVSTDGIERPTGSGFETREQILPEKFHVGSTEKITVSGDEKAIEKNFDLKD